MRIRVKDVQDLLADGASNEKNSQDYPLLETDDVTDTLECAAHQNDHPLSRIV